LYKLNKDLVKNKEMLPDIVEFKDKKNLPERIIQFGEGNFLRGFIDWMIHYLNKKGDLMVGWLQSNQLLMAKLFQN
jgi:tagaturonate reductase